MKPTISTWRVLASWTTAGTRSCSSQRIAWMVSSFERCMGSYPLVLNRANGNARPGETIFCLRDAILAEVEDRSSEHRVGAAGLERFDQMVEVARSA